jgi:hypothetical protein
LRRTIRHFNAAKGNKAKAALAADVSISTFHHRLAEARRRHPDLLQPFGVAKGGTPKLSPMLGQEAWTAYQECGFNKMAAAAQLNLPAGTFVHRLSTYAREHKINLNLLKPTVTLADDISSHRNSEMQQSARAKLKDAIRTITSLEERIKELEWAGNASFQPAEWTLPIHKHMKREHTPYLLTSDFQIGEVIRKEETDAGYGYDSEIFRKRYRRMIDTVIYLSTQHAGSEWKYPGIIYARGGDTISGDIHEELKVTNDMTPEEACECAFEEESAGIAKLADAFGKVDVKAPGAAGNHDRSTFKPWTKQASKRSYDRLIGFMLRNHFKNDPRITFQVSESFDVYFPIYEKFILLTHGDRMGSSGGQGFVGPLATIMRGAQKVIMEQAALGRHVDRVDHGHFHTAAYLDWVLSNGCMPGYSEFAKSFRMRPQPPQQFLLYHHPKRGVVDIKPIILTEDK